MACQAENPDGLIKLSFLGADTGPGLYIGNTTNKAEGIPACKGCASGLRRYNRWLKVATYTSSIPGLILWVLAKESVVKIPTFVAILLVIAGVVLPVIISQIFSPSFGATFLNDQATFEFKSKTVADEFMALNSEA